MGCGTSRSKERRESYSVHKHKEGGLERKGRRNHGDKGNPDVTYIDASSYHQVHGAERTSSFVAKWLLRESKMLRIMVDRFETQERKEQSILNIPAEDVVTFLRDMKTKLGENDILSKEGERKMNLLIDYIIHGTIYTAQIDEDDVTVDPQTRDYLLGRYEVDLKKSKEGLSYSKSSFRLPQRVSTLLKEETPKLEVVPSPHDFKTIMRKEVWDHLENVDQWDFDPFRLHEITSGNPMSVLVYTLFRRWNLISKLELDEKKFQKYLLTCEGMYLDNPYHNRIHAADAVHCVHWILLKCELSGYLKDHILATAILAVAMHDLDHPGLNNAFQVNTRSSLALIYNDVSVLENHHVAKAFETLFNPEFNFLAHFSTSAVQEMRQVWTKMVLATDMSLHSRFLSKWKSRLRGERLEFSSREDVTLLLQIAMKCADISNLTKPWHLNIMWVERVTEEFYRQGDRERELKMAISPMCDRSQPTLAKGQKAFIDFVVRPLFQSFVDMFPKAKIMVDTMTENRKKWDELDKMQKAEESVRSRSDATPHTTPERRGCVESPTMTQGASPRDD
eukprot:TRINITY_DN853_c0_g1_i1.p1 TRINITY_DN853_c0_g1~~TRINITY_DN853_c0_g1_i1.p1  ORF type:complete len:563 (+),score=134.06 TRINITY_DN853_c0_g1_i1:163-1851(+)